MGGMDLSKCKDFLDRKDYKKVEHGTWIENELCVYQCSECGFQFTSADDISKFKYCRCGTKMDGNNINVCSDGGNA